MTGAGLEEETLYKEAMANDRKVSLSYTKILALGPGQVGKSTFLYRLMGLMKGNIQTSDPKTQPQSSTGIAELREACITYTSRTGALTSESWQVFDESSDLQCQLDGLMSLLIKQAPAKVPKEVNMDPDSELNEPVYIAEESSRQALESEQKQEPEEQGETDFEEQLNSSSSTKPTQEVEQVIIKQPTTDKSAVSKRLLAASYPLPELSNIDKVIAEFEHLQTACKLAPNKMKFRMLFNIADIGGQPAFLEMLPSLTIGPALYLVFMKLLQGLTTRYPVAFKCKDGRGSKLCKNYTYTSEEVIFTALSSIACFGNSDEEVEQYVTKTGDEEQISSLAVLVGTFRDEIKHEKELSDIDHQLKKQLELTDFFKDGLIHSKSFLPVNNYSAGEDEIKDHRALLQDILEKKFHKYDISTRWLTLSICLKLLARRERRHEVSFDDCVKLGDRLGMKKNMVRVALQFLHKYIGLVMYFPRNKDLKNVVICDPQVVFSSISELIFDIYDPRNMYITEAQHDHFVKTGCFSPQDIKTMDKKTKPTKKLLSVDTLVKLLVHLNIIAEVPSGGSLMSQGEKPDGTDSAKPKKYYFLPAVLQTADLSLLTKEESSEQLPEPLCIRFRTGYLPLGFVCALSANLIAEGSNLQLIPFNDGDQQVTYKNKMKFRFKGKFDIVVISSHRYCEFRVNRLSGSNEFWDNECCPRIKTIIIEATDRVVQSLKHGSLYKPMKELTYELAFKCPKHKGVEIGHEPLAKLVYSDPSSTTSNTIPEEICCVDPSCLVTSKPSPQMLMWFGEVRVLIVRDVCDSIH